MIDADMSTHTHRLKRLLLASAAAVVAVNIWTGAPLLSVWIGSQFAGPTRLSMGAVGIVLAVLTATILTLVTLLLRLNAAYERAAGQQRSARETAPWLRSMRGERHDPLDDGHVFSAVERITVLSVGLCAIAFNVWFFILAPSPLAGR